MTREGAEGTIPSRTGSGSIREGGVEPWIAKMKAKIFDATNFRG